MSLADSRAIEDERDRALIAQLRAGSAVAFREIFDLYAERLVLFARAHLGVDEAAEDVIHDMFTYIWINRKTLEVRGPLRTYLYKGVRNRVINALRDTKTADAFMDRFAAEQDDASGSASITISATELSDAIRQAVAALPARTREIWSLNRDDGLSYTEIAQLLDLSVKTVETQMSRALKSLRVSLAKWRG